MPGAAASWRRVDSMAVARRQMNATLLADGTVLATGGSNAAGFNTKPTDDRVLAAERWNPATEHWTALARQTHYRLYHSTALLLPDARVLSVGSGQPAATGLTDDYTGEIFSPPYLFKLDGTPAVRPTISGAPDNVGYGASIPVTVTSAAPIAKVTWIRLSTVTHATNMNQRMNYLSFTTSGSTLTVTPPANAQPGAAGTLHAVRGGRERGAVGREDRADFLRACWLAARRSLLAARGRRDSSLRALQ